MTTRTISGIRFCGISSYSRVAKAFARGPVQVQRDHAKRAKKAKHIGTALTEPQKVFHLVLLNGQERLIDGYTRIERIQRGLTEAPDSVIVIVYDEVHTLERAVKLYDQIDSKASLKRASDRYDEGLRLTDMLNGLNSHLVKSAQGSAPQWAVGATSIRDGVVNAEKGMRYVDSLGLDKTNEILGQMALYFSIGQYASFLPEVAESFIRKVNQRVFAPMEPSSPDMYVLAYRKLLANRRELRAMSGGTNVKDVHEQGLLAFLGYAGLDPRQTGSMAKNVSQISLGNFIQTLEMVKKANKR